MQEVNLWPEQTHLIFWGEVFESGKTSESMDLLTQKLCDLSMIEWVKDRVKLISWEWKSSTSESQDEFEDRIKETKEVAELRNKLYEKLFQDIEQQYSKKDGKILIQVPLSHAWDFIPQLIQKKNTVNSKFSMLDIEYVIIDPASIENIASDEASLHELYKWYLTKIEAADKFIQIVDTADANATFVNDEENKRWVAKVASDYQTELNRIWKERQNKLRLYFPTQEMADNEGMSLKEFIELELKAVSLDWPRIAEWNQEWVDLIKEYDSVTIKWLWTDISFDISWMWARNSVIQTNWPGSEFHTAPRREWVNGSITYDNEVYIKMLGETIPWITFKFEDGKLVFFEILETNLKRKRELSEKLWELFDEEEGNRYLWELAFGTNFFVPTWIKHPLIWEKALGMHMAFWKSYNYDWVDNWNNDWGGIKTSFHWDAIKDMSDCVVSFHKEWKDSIEVMRKAKFNAEVLPKLSEYQKEIDSKIAA
jgi:leucyl aminopeptidase (aminopeptidase T)